MLQQLYLVQLPQQILIFRPEPSRHSQALEFKLKNLSYIHSLNKTKQPFYNLFQCFRVKDNLRKNSKKNFEKLTLKNSNSYIILHKKLAKYLIKNRFYKSFKIEPVSPLVFLDNFLFDF